MEDRDDAWTPPGRAERYDPLPSFLLLPARGWRRLSRRGRLILVALVLAGATAIALSWPQVERDKRAGEAERAERAAERRAARRAELVEDQRPRRAALPAPVRARIRDAGGLGATAAAHMAGARLESAIARDVRSRIAAGDLAGPLLETTCDPVKVRTPRGAGFNCFALTDRSRSGGRVLESGYRFSARAELAPGTLAWCKENPRPLHPTSYVISVPISPDCR
jgi:hypothetical protein